MNLRADRGLTATALSLLLLLATSARPQAVLHSRLGDVAGDALGVLADAGDLDGDGLSELALGAPEAAGGRGQVRVLAGADDTVLFTVEGPWPGGRLGAALACVGDVDGDGRPDLLAGAPGAASGAGRVLVLSGHSGAILLDLPAGAGGRLGHAVAAAGDADQDGTPDLLSGAPLAPSAQGPAAGEVLLHSGADGSLLATASGAPGDQLGFSLGGATAIDGDVTEILGATCDGNGGAGYVDLRNPLDLGLRTRVHGTAAGQRFGAALALPGDVDLDGHADLAVGAPGAGGSVTLLSGAELDPLLVLPAPSADGSFGAVLARTGDLNADGRPDLAVGAPLSGRNGPEAGALLLVSGADGAVLHDVLGGAPGERLGSGVAGLGDRSGDGRAEFALAAPGAADGAGLALVVAPHLWNALENGLPGVDGVPRLSGEGGLKDAQSALLVLESARPIASATLVVGLALVHDAGQGVLVPLPQVVVDGLLTGGDGRLEFEFTLPQGLAPGTVVYQQFLLADPAAPGGISRSNTVAATVPGSMP